MTSSARRFVAIFSMLTVGCGGPPPAPPTPASPFAEPGALPETTLRNLPGVAGVEVLVSVADQRHRIIHIRDYHHVPRDLFAIDMSHAAGRTMPGAEVDRLYAAFLNNVDSLQAQQELLLGALVEQYGLRQVMVEGLTDEGQRNYDGIVNGFKATSDRLDALRAEAAALEFDREPHVAQIDRLIRGLRVETLPYGAAGRFAGRQQLKVLPLDDAALLETANPVRPDGTVKADPKVVAARNDAQVRRALAGNPVTVIVLGGNHDLSAAVRRLGGGTTEYIRVTPLGYDESVAGGGEDGNGAGSGGSRTDRPHGRGCGVPSDGPRGADVPGPAATK
ncbi:MAG TPA: hypothetical protein VD866_17535 [Urbifossiella sp.]|nr:hypothetical protein [Urbifossiella sp.]